MSDEGFVPAGDDASEAVAAAAAAAAALGHDHPEDTAPYHHQYGEAGPDAIAGGPHGGVESNRWAKNFEGMAPETLTVTPPWIVSAANFSVAVMFVSLRTRPSSAGTGTPQR